MSVYVPHECPVPVEVGAVSNPLYTKLWMVVTCPVGPLQMCQVLLATVSFSSTLLCYI